jgi:ABC-type transport system involved in multi-copper enzyme maturation permease subunit
MTVLASLSRIGTLAGMVWMEMLRRKDVYVLMILLVFLLAYLLGLQFFESQAAHRYITEMGLLMAWLFSWILCIQLTSRQLPMEERSGTIFPLLSKPVRRWEILAGKWLGSWSASFTATAVFYVAVATVVEVRGGQITFPTYLQGYVLHAALLAILSALALMLSTRLTGEAAVTLSYLIAVVCFVFVPKAGEMLMYASGPSRGFVLGLYYGLPHFEFFDLRRRIVHGWGSAPWSVAMGTLIYGAAWTGALLLIAQLLYRGKPIHRGRAA